MTGGQLVGGVASWGSTGGWRGQLGGRGCRPGHCTGDNPTSLQPEPTLRQMLELPMSARFVKVIS